MTRRQFSRGFKVETVHLIRLTKVVLVLSNLIGLQAGRQPYKGFHTCDGRFERPFRLGEGLPC